DRVGGGRGAEGDLRDRQAARHESGRQRVGVLGVVEHDDGHQPRVTEGLKNTHHCTVSLERTDVSPSEMIVAGRAGSDKGAAAPRARSLRPPPAATDPPAAAGAAPAGPARATT